MPSIDATPVIVGVAQATWRERDAGRSPVDALQAVAEAAFEDCGTTRLRAAVDAVVHVPFLLNQVPELAPAMPRNAGAAVAGRLGLRAAQYSADVGGNLPQQLLEVAAARLRAGEHRAVLLAGAELLHSFLGGLRAGEGLPDWHSGRDDEPQLLLRSPPMSADSELAHGLYEPVAAYPLFESALRHRLGLDAQGQAARLGRLVSDMSRVAADNPRAWKQRFYTPQEVLDPAAGNRYVCHPYTKLMNAIIAVDMAACVLLTTAGTARELGVPPEQCVYLRGAASAADALTLSERPSLSESPALRAAGRAALGQSGLALDELDCLDLYSCFPSAVQVGCEALGLALEDPRGLTVTGGLTLFGGPGNNYSLHAIAELCTRLRARRPAAGLVWANGGYLSKHAVGVYASEAPAQPWEPPDAAVLQASVDALPRPALAPHGEGALTVEACTVRYEQGEPALGIVLGRLADGRRCLAQSRDAAALQRLLEDDCVGLRGQVAPGEPVNRFAFSGADG